MKAIIQTDETNLSSIQFKKSNKVVSWESLTQDEQVKFLNALYGYYELYSKFKKK